MLGVKGIEKKSEVRIHSNSYNVKMFQDFKFELQVWAESCDTKYYNILHCVTWATSALQV